MHHRQSAPWHNPARPRQSGPQWSSDHIICQFYRRKRVSNISLSLMERCIKYLYGPRVSMFLELLYPNGSVFITILAVWVKIFGLVGTPLQYPFPEEEPPRLNSRPQNGFDFGHNFQGQMWPWPLTTRMALTKDFRGQILKKLYLRMGGPIDIDQRGGSRSFMTMTVTIWFPRSGVRIDLPNSDRGDLRCRRAVDSSILRQQLYARQFTMTTGFYPCTPTVMLLKLKIFNATIKLRVRKPKGRIWPPGGHFDSNIADNQ